MARGGAMQMFTELADAAGILWVCALAAACVAMILESSAPKRPQGEDPPHMPPLRFVAMTTAIITPGFLLLHGVGASLTANKDLIAPVIAVVAVVMIASIAGWIIGAVAPGLGKMLNTASPLISIGVCAFTIWVTWPIAWALIDAYVAAHFR